MSKITLKPVHGKVWLKPDQSYVQDTIDGEKVFKSSKESKIVIPKSVTEKKVRDILVGTVEAACPFAGVDGNNNQTTEFKKGQRVVYFGANVSVLFHKGEQFHLIPGEYCIAIVAGE